MSSDAAKARSLAHSTDASPADFARSRLLEAIAEFSRFYQDAFLSHFPQGHPVANIPDTPHLILGGGTGFLSKTVGYPYLKDDYAAALFKSRCSCSMHPCRRSYRVGPMS